jgi:hypothetical protein
MKPILLMLFITVVTTVSGQIQSNQTNNGLVAHEGNSVNNSVYSLKLITVENNTWCYDIYKNNKLLIHQTSIPGLSGKYGFKSKSDAEKVGRLVIEKLTKGEMPPTVTNDELNKLNVL